MICPICTSDSWERIDKQWFRCVKCGYLDQPPKERYCQRCGKPIGRYAKPTTKVCIECRDKAAYTERPMCETPYCYKRVTLGNKICDECKEQMNWPNDGPAWKAKAAELFQRPHSAKVALKILRRDYPEIKQSELTGWIRRGVQNGLLVKLKRGMYQRRQPSKPKIRIFRQSPFK